MSVISRFCGRICSNKISTHKPVLRMEIRQFRKAKPKSEFNPTETPLEFGHGKPVGFSALKRPILFGAVFTGLTVSGCGVWQYENMREAARKSKFPGLNFNFGRKAGSFREEIRQWWNSLQDHEKLFIPICTINCLVFCGWRIPALQGFMMKWFLASPSGSATCIPMLLSTFSHHSIMHLGFNMFALHSFMRPVVQLLGQEQFLAVYLSSGVLTSLASYIFKIGSGRLSFSLGASGAICTVLGVFATLVPDAMLQIVFLPGYTFTASTAIKGMMCLDTVGMVAGWRLFDHAAHLSGVLYGIFWCYFGSRLLWDSRKTVVEVWHEFRTSQTK